MKKIYCYRNLVLRAKKQLEANGWKVHWSYQGFFGMWDLLAYSETDKMVQYLWIRVKKSLYSEKWNEYKSFPCPDNVLKSIWIWHEENKKFEVVFM